MSAGRRRSGTTRPSAAVPGETAAASPAAIPVRFSIPAGRQHAMPSSWPHAPPRGGRLPRFLSPPHRKAGSYRGHRLVIYGFRRVCAPRVSPAAATPRLPVAGTLPRRVARRTPHALRSATVPIVPTAAAGRSRAGRETAMTHRLLPRQQTEGRMNTATRRSHSPRHNVVLHGNSNLPKKCRQNTLRGQAAVTPPCACPDPSGRAEASPSRLPARQVPRGRTARRPPHRGFPAFPRPPGLPVRPAWPTSP